jgi:hypothetical protein
MSNPEGTAENRADSPAGELLALYDELTALHAASAFVMQALAAAQVYGGGLDERSATGAVFCARWLDERAIELEQELKGIVSRACTAGAMAGSRQRGG